MKSGILSTLQKQGNRITKARKSIVSILEGVDHPLTARAISIILKKIGSPVNITTVYRELHFLHLKGVLSKIPISESEMYYELSGGPHHHHFKCVVCGSLSKMYPDRDDHCIENFTKKTTFDITNHHIILYGNCLSCK